MPEWLQEAVQNGSDISLMALLLRLLLAFALGTLVAGIYRWTRQQADKSSPSFIITLVLMTIVIAMSTQVIGNNVARAFSLVGALSIVRFRTVVQDTRDTVFVIFSVVVGMAIGAGHLAVAVLGIVITGMASLVMQRIFFVTDTSGEEMLLVVRLATGLPSAPSLSNILAKYLADYELQNTASAKRGSAIYCTYLVRPKRAVSLTDLVSELSGSEGVQNVELHRNKF